MEESRFVWGKMGDDGRPMYFEYLNSFEVGEPEPEYRHTLMLSEAALAVRDRIIKPMSERTPVKYNPDWLRNYQPNQDYYLNKQEREYLHKIGVTADQDKPSGSFARNMLERLLIDLSWNSSRLEGNSYSLLDTERLITNHEVAEKKTSVDTQMIINHKEAIEFLVEEAEYIRLTPFYIRNLHGVLSHRLMEDVKTEGRLRQIPVGIGQSVYTPLAIPAQIAECFDLVLEKADQIQDPFEQSFFLMVHLPYLQPFQDVNKRVSRLAANIPLNRHNLIPLSFTGVDRDHYVQGLLSVYELNETVLYKEVFIWAYERSVRSYGQMRQILRSPSPFLKRYHFTLKKIVQRIVTEQMSKAAASRYIEEYLKDFPLEDREKLNEAASRELLAIHEGSIARYRVSLATFRSWQKHW